MDKQHNKAFPILGVAPFYSMLDTAMSKGFLAVE
jgi:hypothetical protein